MPNSDVCHLPLFLVPVLSSQFSASPARLSSPAPFPPSHSRCLPAAAEPGAPSGTHSQAHLLTWPILAEVSGGLEVKAQEVPQSPVEEESPSQRGSWEGRLTLLPATGLLKEENSWTWMEGSLRFRNSHLIPMGDAAHGGRSQNCTLHRPGEAEPGGDRGSE